MLSIVLEMVSKIVSKMRGFETSLIPEIVHDSAFSNDGTSPNPRVFDHFLSHVWGIPGGEMQLCSCFRHSLNTSI